MDILAEARRDGRTLFLDLLYPREPDAVDTLQIGLECVRASDGIQVSYDFDRDGWAIKQPTRTAECDGDEGWTEVAFLESWSKQIVRPEGA